MNSDLSNSDLSGPTCGKSRRIGSEICYVNAELFKLHGVAPLPGHDSPLSVAEVVLHADGILTVTLDGETALRVKAKVTTLSSRQKARHE